MSDQQKTILLSVVVIGRNEGERLTKCLSSVRNMHFMKDQMELIYVDSASMDDSLERAKVFEASIIKIITDRPTGALARNTGWKAAQGQYILFLDGDTVLDADFVTCALSFFANPQIAIICGYRREILPKASIYNLVLDLDWKDSTGIIEYCGGDALIRRTVLEEVSGYDSQLIAGEDAELSRRIREKGYQILRIDRTMVSHHLNINNFGQYWKRTFRTGYAYAEVSQRFIRSSDPIWRKESRHNLWKGTMIIFLGIFSLSLSLFQITHLPLLLFLIGAAILALRTALKTHIRCSDWLTCILYGFHSQFQHIPLWFGQMAYWVDRLLGNKRSIIEYKDNL